MSDLISRRQAIEALERAKQNIRHNIERAIGRAICEILDEVENGIKQLPSTNCSEFPNNSDTISRQAAIDLWEKYHPTIAVDAMQYDAELRQLPSAQPEIIRCTECKHYREYDSKYVENAVVVQCMADRYPISETIPDGWFCAGAERRTDEQ